jgi:DNA-binding SARP family transcriptional activator
MDANADIAMADLVKECQILEQAGKIAEVLKKAAQALALAEARNDPYAIGTALVIEARARFRLGQYREASALAHKALTFVPEKTVTQAEAWVVLGICAGETDDMAACEDYLRRVVELSRELGNYRLLARTLHNLSAGIYMPRGQFSLSLKADEEALWIENTYNLAELRWGSLVTMAWVYWLTHQCALAHATLAQLFQVMIPGSIAAGYYYNTHANLALDEGRLDEAMPLYAHCRSIAETTGDPGLGVSVRLGMSHYYWLCADAAAARHWADEALTLARRVEYRHMQGLALIERGRAAWLCKDWMGAEADLRAAIEILTPLKLDFDLARAQLLLAVLLELSPPAPLPHEEHSRISATPRPHSPNSSAGMRPSTGPLRRGEQEVLDAFRAILDGNYIFLLEQERSLAFPLLAAHLNSTNKALGTICADLLQHLQSIPPESLQIITLGRFEIWQGQRQVAQKSLRQRRAAELFALLLLTPDHCLAFDEVVEALWPDKPPQASRTGFHQATSALRRALEPDLPDKFPSRYLKVDEGQVRLCLPPGSRLDYQDFEAHCKQGQWQAALSLYAGDLLPEFRYADWVVAQRQWLMQDYQRALLAHATQLLEINGFQEALDACRRVLALEPWQEQAVLLGMRACLGLDDLTGARRLYSNLEKSLRDDLGAEPQAKLQKFYREQILSQQKE